MRVLLYVIKLGFERVNAKFFRMFNENALKECRSRGVVKTVLNINLIIFVLNY